MRKNDGRHEHVSEKPIFFRTRSHATEWGQTGIPAAKPRLASHSGSTDHAAIPVRETNRSNGTLTHQIADTAPDNRQQSTDSHNTPNRGKFVYATMISAGLSLTACGNVHEVIDDKLKNKAVDYKTSRELPPLEVPPDLVLPSGDNVMEVPPTGSMTYSEYASHKNVRGPRENVLPNAADIRFIRDGDSRWLVINAEPDEVWPKAREFWLNSGFLLKREDPTIGIMETDWAENRADIPSGLIRSLLGKYADAIYSASTRDKFRVRLERGKEEGTTELYLSHQGVEEVTHGTNFVWQARPSDPELEAEMLNRMIVFFGVEKEKTRAILAEGDDSKDRAYLVRGNEGEPPVLLLQEGFSRAWRRTGLALDRVGFTVEDRDRSRGLFYVHYIDPLRETQEEGWFSKLKFWGGDEEPEDSEYLIRLHEQIDPVNIGITSVTRIELLNKDGELEQSATAERVLGLLYEQLK